MKDQHRKPWQEHVAARHHMIEVSAVDAGYTSLEIAEGPRIVDRIAVVDVSGVLVNEAWDGWRTSSYGRIAAEVAAAAEDPDVDGILLRVNSPGGETTAAFETADEIINARYQKPVWAVADSTAYSAGYLLASAAQRIYVSPKTGGVGSIGVYGLHLDLSGMLERDGVKATFIESPKGKSDGHPYKPLSAEERKRYQAEIDRLAGLFFAHVADRRGLDEKTVRDMGARTYDGAEAAIDAGLADRAGGFDVAFAQFRGYLDARAEQDVYRIAATAAQGERMEAQQVVAQAAAEQAAALTASAVEGLAGGPPPLADGAIAADAELREYCAEVAGLCALAGFSPRAAGYIRAARPLAEVRAELQTARAEADESLRVSAHVLPDAGATPGWRPETASLEDSPLVKLAEEQAAKARGRR